MELAGVAFGEDKTMIEAQQKVIDRSPGARIMPTAHDKGVTIFTRLVERLAKAETSAATLPEKVA
jgi:vanillate O-demethylase monooxygenase subunit